MEYFTEDGDLTDEFIKKVWDKGATGEEALMYLADEFACQTHGNYTALTLYSRAGKMEDVDIVIKPRKSTPINN